jgi:hypothetical protein
MAEIVTMKTMPMGPLAGLRTEASQERNPSEFSAELPSSCAAKTGRGVLLVELDALVLGA